MKNWLKGLTSRKFILALVSAAVAFGNFMWGWGLTEVQVLTIISPLLAFIGVEGAADTATRIQAGKAAATQLQPGIPAETAAYLNDLTQTDDFANDNIVPGRVA